MARQRCTIIVNGQPIRARVGETLLDAALGGRVVLPHDCCTGQCETCRVRVLSGAVDDAGTASGQTVLGCLATLEGDAVIAFDPVPPLRRVRGEVERITAMSPDLLEVRVRLERLLTWLPGQYVRVRFGRLPARDYSPTIPLDRSAEPDVLVFHIKVYPDSRVSSRLGQDIQSGHRVSILGPFGAAYLKHQPERLVLASTGTGFAPLWAISVAALLGQPGRPIRLIAGARTRDALYMTGVSDWLASQGVDVKVTAGDGDGWRIGTKRPAELLGALSESDVVYAAGAPAHVDAVRAHAVAAGATFYADPFHAAPASGLLPRWLSQGFRRDKVARPDMAGVAADARSP